MAETRVLSRFDPVAWLQGQVAILVSADLATAAEARAAVETIAADDRFWEIVEPVCESASEALSPLVALAEAEAEAAARHRRGLS